MAIQNPNQRKRSIRIFSFWIFSIFAVRLQWYLKNDAFITNAFAKKAIYVELPTTSMGGRHEASLSYNKNMTKNNGLPIQKRPRLPRAGTTFTNQTRGNSTIHLPILFLHFHKAGGTEVCRMMQTNQKLVTLTNQMGKKIIFPSAHNCNADRAGPRIDVRVQKRNRNSESQKPSLRCQAFTNYTTDSTGRTPFVRNNFMAAEVPLDHAFSCPNFRIFTLVRNPIARSQSHMKMKNWTPDFIQSIFNSTQKPSQEPRNLLGAYVLRVYPSLDNMQIRQLLGLPRLLDIDRPIDEKDLKQAKALVDAMAVAVPTEQQLHPKVLKLFQERIPEYYAALQTRYRKNIKELNGSPPQPRHTHYNHKPAFVELLKQHNKYDMQLHEYLHTKLGIDPPQY